MNEDMVTRFKDPEHLARSLAKQDLVQGARELAKSLANAASVQNYRPGEDVITEGRAGQEHLYFIISGNAELLVGGIIRHEAGDGEVFGEFPILNPGTRHDVTLRAKEPGCLAALVHEKDVRRIAQEHPVLWENMANMIARRLREANKPLRRKRGPRIFISHRHDDEDVAESLISLLEAAFELDVEDIRCTSIEPYTLDAGCHTSETLRNEIRRAEAVVGLISPTTNESTYVLFELGASWSGESKTMPFLIKGATPDLVPDPLRELNVYSLESEENCWKLIDNLSIATKLSQRGNIKRRIAKEVSRLAKSAKP